VLRTACAALLVLVLAGCTQAGGQDGTSSKAERTPPRLGACRALVPDDITQASNQTAPVGCSQRHTAETFAVGTFPEKLADADNPDDRALGAYVYDRCQQRFQEFLGGDESLVLRSTMTWAWFRPTKDAWADGARWYRCDVVGGPIDASSYRSLPRTLRGFMSSRPDEDWTLCARGTKVAGSEKVPCSTKHDWRAVTTIKLGQPDDAYPGDRIAQIRSQQYCSDSVGAWLNYPATNYDYGVTVFHEAEWKAGNRRSICWARTDT